MSKDQSDQERAARNTLESLNRPSSLLHDGMITSAKRAGSHFGGREDGTLDPAEIWGRRIGRGLSLAAFIALCFYLFMTFTR